MASAEDAVGAAARMLDLQRSRNVNVDVPCQIELSFWFTEAECVQALKLRLAAEGFRDIEVWGPREQGDPYAIYCQHWEAPSSVASETRTRWLWKMAAEYGAELGLWSLTPPHRSW